MARQRRYVRQMPRIYGNLQKPTRSYDWVGVFLKRVIWTCVAGILIYGLFFTGWFSIRSVEVEGTVFSSPETAQAAVKKGSPIWALSQADVSNRVMQDSAVASVSVLRGLPDSVRIVVHEKTPSLRWVSGSTVTILDENGIAFLQYPADKVPAAGTTQGDVLANIPEVKDTKNLPVAIGDTVVSPLFLAFVDSVQKNLALSFPTFEMDHMEISDTTYDLTIVEKRGLQAQLNTLGDAGVQIRNLTRLVDQKKASMTSHVDLRIDRWAYVKP